jgi:hypothetical protein
MSILRITLSAPNVPDVVFNNNRAAQGLHTTKEAIKGLWSAPSLKTSLTERQTGDGAFTPGQVLYSARTVTIPFVIVDYSHDNLQAYRDSIGRLMGSKRVRMSVVDGDNIPFYVIGHIQPEYSDVFHENGDTGSINIVCEDPCRYSVETKSNFIHTRVNNVQGLQWGKTYSGLIWPLNFGVVDYRQATGVVYNHGSYVTYPVFDLIGWYHTCALDWKRNDGVSGTLSYNGVQIQEIPVVIDCKTRKAMMGNSDVTSYLDSLQFPSIPPGGSLTINARSEYDGGVNIRVQDTWM